MDKIDSNEIIQIGIVVKNIEETAKNYAELFGLPMPQIKTVRPQELTHATYRGKPMMSEAKLCSFKMGAANIELTQPDEKDSIWKELLDTRGEGVQWLGFNMPDPKANTDMLEKKGIKVLHWGDTGKGTYSMMDTMSKLKVSLNIKGPKSEFRDEQKK